MNPIRFVLLLSLTSSSVAFAVAPASCPSVFAVSKPVATDAAREARMKETEKWQVSMIDGTMLGHSDTPPFYFEVSGDQQATYITKTGGLHGQFSHLEVTGLGAEGILRGTLELPVSGHTGLPNAIAWSKTDTFDIYMQVGEGPKGDQFGDYSAKLIPVVSAAKSTDLVTRQDVEIPMTQGKQVRVLYYRSGSGGPYGYPEGRIMTFAWDGK